MTHPDIRAALGRERRNTLLADAEAARVARQARLYRRQAATPAHRGSPPQRRAGIGTRVGLLTGLLLSVRAHLVRRHPRIAEYEVSLSRSRNGPPEATG